MLGAKARAAMDGRPMPDLDDVRAMALPVLGHRIVVNFQGEAEGIRVADLLT
jgi:MoxR-like ATPase